MVLFFRCLKAATLKSSYQRCSMRKGVPRNFTKLPGKHLCSCLFFNKVAGLKNRIWHRCFPVNFVKFLRTPSLQNTSGRLVHYSRKCSGKLAEKLYKISFKVLPVKMQGSLCPQGEMGLKSLV